MKISYTSRIIILSFLIIAGCRLTSMAQWYDPDKVNKKAGDVYAQAYEEAREGKLTEAITHLQEALRYDANFVDVYLSRAGIYANLRNYPASVADFEKAMQMDSVYSKVYDLPYSISLAGLGRFDKALQIVNRFLENPRLNEQSKKAGEYRKSTYEFALQYEKDNNTKGYVFTPTNMGDSINTRWLEYFPSLTIDGKKMIFTRRMNNDEDFYETDFINGHWVKARPIPGKINTNLNEGAQTIAQDGSILIFTGCNYPEGKGSCDLYIAYQTKNGGWTEPENLPGVINTEFWESSPSLSPDKKDLYFSSNRLGGLGGKDIWVSSKKENGQWSEPKNLGPTINTSADEGCPFIHADNQTLYFNSNGWPGYGNTDLFVSKKTNDNTWGTPLNLGYPINTIDDEGSLIVASDGKTSYYASDGTDTRGGLDLYSFTLRDDISALKTLWVKGRVYDNKTKQGLPSSVEVSELGGVNTSKLQTDETGHFLVTLPAGKDYAFNVNRKGYLFYSDNFSLLKGNIDTAIVIDIPLQPLEAGASIVLKNIFFDSKETALKPQSEMELDRVVQLMKDNPATKIEISGHTDNVGKPADNLLLSMNRSKSVVQYLTGRGIAASRLSTKGFGETKPIADNDTEEGRAHNRRTELKIISN